MAKEDLQKVWSGKIAGALKVRAEWEDQFRVGLGRAYFEGQQNPGYPEDEWISIPKIYAHLQAQLPFLYSIDPYFYVKLKKSHAKGVAQLDEEEFAALIAETEAKGTIRQAMLNYLKGAVGLKPKARLGIQDAHFAYGVLKARHASDSEEHPNAGEPILDDDGNPVLDDETGETQVYPDTLPINKRYECLRIHPDDFLFDADAGPLDDSWGWLAQRLRMSVDEVKDDKRFKAGARKTVTGKMKADDQDTKKFWSAFKSKKKTEDEEEEFVDVWEVYDLKANKTLTLAENAEDLLIDPRSTSPGIDGHPYSILRFTLRDKSPYPIPPVSPAIDAQKEVSFARSVWMTHLKRFNRKYWVDVGRLDDAEAEIEKLEHGGDGTVIRGRGMSAIEAIQDAPMDQQSMLQVQAFDNDIVEALGSPGNARGVANADSATEASILDNRLEIREGDRLSMVVDWITDWASKMDKLVQFHIDEEQAVKIVGPQGEFWQLVQEKDYEEIEGEFEYSVNVGASKPRLPDIERAQLMAFFSQVIIPFPHVLRLPGTMKRMAELFHIEDDIMIEELRTLGEQIMQGQLPMPGGQGGGPSENPGLASIGSAMGQTGGNVNGGGAG
jgi:hypothetical protein